MTDARRTLLQLGALGVATAGWQTVAGREFLAAFSGNEAALASFLGAWLLLTGLGSWVGRKGPPRDWAPAAAMVAHGLASAGAVVFTRVLPAFFSTGEAPGPAAAAGWAAAVLAAPCVLSGISFAWLSAGRASAGRAYFAETLGAATAGAACSLLLLDALPPLTLGAGLLAFASLAAALRGRVRVPVLAGLLAAAALAVLPVGRWALQKQGLHLERPLELHSPYSSLYVGEGTAVYVDRRPVPVAVDVAFAEEAAHVPLGLVEAPERIALVGIPPPAAVREALKHGVERVDWVLEDEVLQRELSIRIEDLRSREVSAQAEDARRYLAARPSEFDAVILLHPEPTSAQLNRFFTVEFFAAVRAALRSGGVLALALPELGPHAREERRRLYSSVARTLEAAFGDCRVLPLSRTWLIASRELPLPPHSELGAAVLGRMSERGARAEHLRLGTLSVLLTQHRLVEAERTVGLPAEVNRDLWPTTYRLALDRLLAEYGEAGTGPLIALAVLVASLALLAFNPRRRAAEFAVMTSGAAGLTAQLTLMLAYQLATGALYREMGLLLAGFMLGSSAGAWLGGRGLARRWLVGSDVAQAALLAIVALGVSLLTAAGGWARPLAFLIALVLGVPPGAQFAAAGRHGSKGGVLYAADLAGAALAALATFTALVPAVGIAGAIGMAAVLKGLSALVWLVPPGEEIRPPDRVGLITLGLFAALVLVAASESTHGSWYAVTSLPSWQMVSVGWLLGALLLSVGPERLQAALTRCKVPARKLTALALFRLASMLGLGPAAALPLGRCYFAVPFAFCHACPRQCAFGMLRPYAIPAALLANAFDRSFCLRICPLGTVQDACGGLRSVGARRWLWLRYVRLVSLFLVVSAYFLAQYDKREGIQGGGFFLWMFRNRFSPSSWVLLSSAALLVLSAFVRRPFCEGLCPVGAASSLLAPLERRLGRRPADEPGPGLSPQ